MSLLQILTFKKKYQVTNLTSCMQLSNSYYYDSKSNVEHLDSLPPISHPFRIGCSWESSLPTSGPNRMRLCGLAESSTFRNLLLMTSPWCFFLAHPFLLKSLIVTFECSRPPTFVEITRSDPSNISVAMSRIRTCLNSSNIWTRATKVFKHFDV